MEKAKRVCNFYVLAIRLKDTIRKGFINACVTKYRMESVAEHVYGVLNLAIAIFYTYKPKNIDLSKVLFMLTIHELDEIVMGDIAMTDSNYDEVKKESHNAIMKVLSTLEGEPELVSIALEFEEQKTENAKFAYLCDKLECDLYVKAISEKNEFDIEKLKTKEDNFFAKRIKTGKETLAELWFPGDVNIYENSDIFREIFEYAELNNIINN